MKIINEIPDLFSDDELLDMSEWVRGRVAYTRVNKITFNHEADDFTWNGYAWFGPRTMRVSMGKKQGAMRYYREGILFDPCGKEEIAIVAIGEEQLHIKLQTPDHDIIIPEVYELLKLWRKKNGKRSKIVRRFLFLVTEIRKRLS